jgi:hypothetical protein
VEKVEGLWRGNEELYAEEFPEREEESDCIEKASSDYVSEGQISSPDTFCLHGSSPRDLLGSKRSITISYELYKYELWYRTE